GDSGHQDRDGQPDGAKRWIMEHGCLPARYRRYGGKGALVGGLRTGTPGGASARGSPSGSLIRMRLTGSRAEGVPWVQPAGSHARRRSEPVLPIVRYRRGSGKRFTSSGSALIFRLAATFPPQSSLNEDSATWRRTSGRSTMIRRRWVMIPPLSRRRRSTRAMASRDEPVAPARSCWDNATVIVVPLPFGPGEPNLSASSSSSRATRPATSYAPH